MKKQRSNMVCLWMLWIFVQLIIKVIVMSEKITAENLDQVIQKNKEIRADIERCSRLVFTRFNRMQVGSPPQLAIQLLRTYGLIQMPIDNPYLSGAIYVKNGKKIPFINTALPRVNQYFAAWHELYHLLFDEVSFDHFIELETTMEERKAEYFASRMLLGNLMSYFSDLPKDMDFRSKVYNCMAVFQTPYKAVLIALYETASEIENSTLMSMVKDNFDSAHQNMTECFGELGLDNTLVLPSYVVDVSILRSKIKECEQKRPDLSCHKDNQQFLEMVMKEIKLAAGTSYA
ncbi:MAG: ImmA/IrrE family metallo-endopeptidase [Eubacterium sp.]|nr:ImmA/IrrE family metallo-endopeptidase [Eubacterium sp.]